MLFLYTIFQFACKEIIWFRHFLSVFIGIAALDHISLSSIKINLKISLLQLQEKKLVSGNDECACTACLSHAIFGFRATLRFPGSFQVVKRFFFRQQSIRKNCIEN